MDLVKIIKDWQTSKDYNDMIKGEKYYCAENDIKNREFYYWIENKKEKDPYRANMKIPTNFLKMVIDQKVSYCVGKDIIIDFPVQYDINSEIAYTCEIASQKKVAWVHIYMDQNQIFKVKTMKDSENFIPIYDGTIEENITKLIRTYEKEQKKFAEVWNKKYKTTYVFDGEKYAYLNSETHLNNDKSWEKIPFIPLYNNRYNKTDLNPIKILIDSIDIILSDFTNNFIDFQDVILMVKNYAENVRTESAAAEFMEWLKKHKIINVKDNGAVEIIAQEVPWEARKEFISIARKLIFLFAQAVDIDEISGTNLTNVNIRSKYSLLDQKANLFIKEIKRFLYEFLDFNNTYYKLKNDTNSIQQTPGQTKIIFNKSQLMNEKEIIESLVLQVGQGLASRKTLISNNPMVDGDIDKEIIAIDKEEYNNGDKDGDLL